MSDFRLYSSSASSGFYDNFAKSRTTPRQGFRASDRVYHTVAGPRIDLPTRCETEVVTVGNGLCTKSRYSRNSAVPSGVRKRYALPFCKLKMKGLRPESSRA